MFSFLFSFPGKLGNVILVNVVYRNQVAELEEKQEVMEVNIRKRLQGCTLPPIIVNLYIEGAMNPLKEKLYTFCTSTERV